MYVSRYLQLKSGLIVPIVVWIIDLHLITALFGIFIFNILDRSNIASARLGCLQKDLNSLILNIKPLCPLW
jgi:hypothetical protein